MNRTIKWLEKSSRVIVATSVLAVGISGASEAFARESRETSQQKAIRLPSDVSARDQLKAFRMFLEMKFYDRNGIAYTLSDWVEKHHKPLMVVMFATWCSPCMNEMPSLESLYGVLGDEVSILPICIERLSPKQFIPGVKRMPLYYSEGGKGINAYAATIGIRSIPTTLLFDKHGTLVKTYSGEREWDSLKEILNIRLRLGLSTRTMRGTEKKQ